jgi:NADP-dependent 3-hydroxy acid dehydrogenase YdfG
MLLGQIEGADTTEWRRMIELNTLGAMYTAHAALPHLLAAAEQGPRGIADLVVTSSVAGRQVRPGSGVYQYHDYPDQLAETIRPFLREVNGTT